MVEQGVAKAVGGGYCYAAGCGSRRTRGITRSVTSGPSHRRSRATARNEEAGRTNTSGAIPSCVRCGGSLCDRAAGPSRA